MRMNSKSQYCFVEALPFDTEVFGFKCGRLVIQNDGIDVGLLKHVLETAVHEKFKHIVAKIPTEYVSVSRMLEDVGLRLVLCSLSLEKDISTVSEYKKNDEITVANNTDLSRLMEITRSGFSKGTRFHIDPTFDGEKVLNLYDRWITNLLNNENVQVLMHKQREKIIGYITIESQVGVSVGHVGLFAVDETFQGQGSGSKLLNAVEYYKKDSIYKLSITTESFNYKALRAYTRKGYEIQQSWNVFYFCYKGDCYDAYKRS
jgi:GNAT superfamily N-acetyltransferase